MEITEPRRLYQQLAADLKERIEQGVYLVGDKLPAERFIADEKNVSRTVVREAIIMLEVEGYVEVRKGSGIHVVSNQPRHQQAADNNMEFANYGPFELLQARQLIESNIAEFAATQVTKQDIMKLMAIQEQARGEQCFRDSEWDLQFHIQVALATQNSALAAIVEKMWNGKGIFADRRSAWRGTDYCALYHAITALFTTADLYGPDADNTSTGADPQNARISMREQLSGAKTLPEAPPAPLPRTRRGPDIDTGNRRKRS